MIRLNITKFNWYLKACLSFVLVFLTDMLYAQSTDSGIAAITQVTTEIRRYVPVMQQLVYAVAGVVAVIGAFVIFFKMNNEDQDLKKSIMLVVGACIFLVSAASALPAFFGV